MTQLSFQFDGPQVKTAPGSLRVIRLSKQILTYRLVRGKRRTVGLVIGSAGLEARAPRHTPIAEVEAFIHLKENWINRRLREAPIKPPPLLWREGESVPFLGGRLRLHSAGPQQHGVRRVDGTLLIGGPIDEKLWRRQTLAWIRSIALDLFRARVAHYAALLRVPLPAIGLSNARTQWGSCSANRRILLSWRLALVPAHLIDYVVAHELGHLLELNHSAKFWAIVATMCPDHRNARKELNGVGALLPDF